MAEYRFLLTDLLTGEVKDELPLNDVQYTVQLSRAGSFTGTIPTRHPKATKANLAPSRTGLYVMRDRSIVWGGILWTVQAESGGGLVTIGAEGHWSYLAGPAGAQDRGCFLRVDKTYADEDQLAIVRDLVGTALADSGFPLSVGTETSGVLLSRTMRGYERRNIGAEIQAEAAEAPGFDFSVDSAWSGTTIVNTLRLWAPRQGRRTGIVFELGGNIASLTEQLDGTVQANDVEYVGAGSGNTTVIGRASDTSLLGSYPVLESVKADPQQTDQSVLASEAQAYVNGNKEPARTLPMLTSEVSANVQPGVWQVGDEVTVRGQDGFIDLDDLLRITSYTVSVSSDGGESVSLAFSSAIVF